MHPSAHSHLPSLHTSTHAPHGRRADGPGTASGLRGLLIVGQVILHTAPRCRAARTRCGTLFARCTLLCQARGLTAVGLALMTRLVAQDVLREARATRAAWSIDGMNVQDNNNNNIIPNQQLDNYQGGPGQSIHYSMRT